MRFLFDLDSPILQFLGRLGDLVILNVVFILSCIPVFTIGAANAALYAVVFRMDTEREEPLLRTYFRAFRENFRQGSAVWLVLGLFGVASCLNMVRFSEIGGTLGYLLFLIAMAVMVVCVFMFTYAFPLMSQFRNSTRNTLKNALLLSVANLPRSLAAAVINCFPWALMVLNLYTFIRLSFLWLALYFAAAAYFNSRVLKKVFDALVK